MRLTKAVLHEKHGEFLMGNSPADRIVEDRGICDLRNGQIYSEFVVSVGGDVSVYRVYGSEPKQFTLSIK